MDVGTSVLGNDSTRGTLSEGALAPLLGSLQRRRASGWLRISGMQIRGGIPSVVRLGLRLQDGRVAGVEATDDPLRPLPAAADLAERATHCITRVLACRDAVQSWDPASEKGAGDPAAPWLAALAVRAVERLADAVTVESALGDPGRALALAPPDEMAAAALTQEQRALLARVRGGVTVAEVIRSGGESAARDLLALLCSGAIQWAAVAAEPPATGARPPIPPAPSATGVPKPHRGPRTATSQAALSSTGATAAAPPAPGPTVAAKREEVERTYAALRGANHFQVLEVTVGASPEEVRKAFNRLARRYHPDAQRDPGLQDLRPKLTAVFVAVSDAYGVLKDAAARERYERALGLHSAGPFGGSSNAAADAAPRVSTVGDPVEARLIGAEEALASEQPWEAIRLLEEAIPAATGAVRTRAQLLLGRAYAARDRPREAEKILLEALQSDPLSVPACLLLGRLYRDQGMAKRSRGMFERVLEVDPGNSEARRELGVPADTRPGAPGRGSLLSRLRGARNH
jgi:hypothetical protein